MSADAPGMVTWLVGALAVAFAADHPAIDVLIVLSAAVVASRGASVVPFRPILVAGGAFLVLRAALFGVTAAIGGGDPVGAMAAGLLEGTRFVAVAACFAALLSSTAAVDLLRLVPTALRSTGLVLNIALTFVPQVIATMRDVRESARIRGRPLKGVGSMPALALPVLATSLERSVALAESMEARGYGLARSSRGRYRHHRPLVLPAALGLVIGTAAIAINSAGWISGEGKASLADPPALPAVALATASILPALMAGRGRR